MSTIIQGLIFSWNKNADYAQRLVADLSDEQIVSQPVADGAPANHAAWVLSHLNVYVPIISSIIDGNEFEDPKTHTFGMQSKPESDRAIYESKDALISTFVQGHEKVAAQLQDASSDLFDKSVTLPRWKEVMPTAGIALPYLMILHENTHLGQLSAWRRVLGLPSV